LRAQLKRTTGCDMRQAIPYLWRAPNLIQTTMMPRRTQGRPDCAARLAGSTQAPDPLSALPSNHRELLGSARWLGHLYRQRCQRWRWCGRLESTSRSMAARRTSPCSPATATPGFGTAPQCHNGPERFSLAAFCLGLGWGPTLAPGGTLTATILVQEP